MENKGATFFGLIVMFITTSLLIAQVGIGTQNPTSQLEIASQPNGIPALELNPQTAPIGNADGQLAVIDNTLFMYDTSRSKWLSIESSALQFASNGSINRHNIRFGGNMISADAGPLMPKAGTIVAITATTSFNDNKFFELRVRDYQSGSISTTQSFRFGLTDFEYVNTNLDIDFNVNDFINVRGHDGGAAEDSTIVIWVKWRK